MLLLLCCTLMLWSKVWVECPFGWVACLMLGSLVHLWTFFLAAEREPELQIILNGLACSLLVSLRGLELQTLDWQALNTSWGESERRQGEKGGDKSVEWYDGGWCSPCKYEEKKAPCGDLLASVRFVLCCACVGSKRKDNVSHFLLFEPWLCCAGLNQTIMQLTYNRIESTE